MDYLNTVDALNITMGYPSKNNPAQLLISKLFKLHTNAKQRNEKSYTFLLQRSFRYPKSSFGGTRIVKWKKS